MASVGRRVSRSAGDGDPAARIRHAILRIAELRETAAANAATALVNQAQVERALRLQGMQLVDAQRNIQTAVDAARRAAADARDSDGIAAAERHGRTEEGLRAQIEVIELATRQVERLCDASGDQVHRARTVLCATLDYLDDALREQLRLLRDVERLQRAQVIDEAQSRWGGRPAPD